MVKTFKNLLLEDQLFDCHDIYTWHLVLEYFQDCSTDDLESTLTFLRQGQIWEDATTQVFMECFEDFSLKLVIRVVLMRS